MLFSSRASLIAVLCAFATLGASPAWAEHGEKAGFCPPNILTVCGQTFREELGPLGSVQTFTLPERFVNRSVSVQCTDAGYFELVGTPTSLCEVQSCKSGPVSVCEAQVHVSAQTQVGDKVKVEVPVALLRASAAVLRPSFSAQCVMHDGLPVYEATDTAGVSCADFPCLPTIIDICRETVTLNEPAELGAVVQARTSGGQEAVVQCLGSADRRPVFQITNAADIICQ